MTEHGPPPGTTNDGLAFSDPGRLPADAPRVSGIRRRFRTRPDGVGVVRPRSGVLIAEWYPLALAGGVGGGLGVGFALALRSVANRVRGLVSSSDPVVRALMPVDLRSRLESAAGWRYPLLFAGAFVLLGLGVGVSLALANAGEVRAGLPLAAAVLAGTVAAMATRRWAVRSRT